MLVISMKDNDYSTKTISKILISEIIHALSTIQSYGSVEIYVQDNTVTQITVRNIKKTISQARFQGKKKDIKPPYASVS